MNFDLADQKKNKLAMIYGRPQASSKMKMVW